MIAIPEKDPNSPATQIIKISINTNLILHYNKVVKCI